MVLRKRSPKLIVDNSLNELCDVVDEHVGSKVMVEQMIQKMKLVSCIHKSMIENVE
jgi:hypothetical protein